MALLRSLRLILFAAGAALFAGAASAAPPGLSAQDLALLNRVTWGVDPAAIAQMRALGPQAWLDRQLHPSPDDRLPDQIQAEIDALPISHASMADLLAQAAAKREAAAQITDLDQKTAALHAWKQFMIGLARQSMQRALLRDVYSPDQLKEQMTWFWMNHFNVYLRKSDVAVMVADYEESAIRPHALGRFRDLLGASLRGPAMLRYLDNWQNASGHINENYAREIMELHTMGVGSGYTQKDVQELARILTGVGINEDPGPPKMTEANRALYVRDGLFEFNPSRHDFGDKVFLGHRIKGRGFAEVEEALDILARQPATARHISFELAQYFVGDAPAPALVERMAATFRRTDGDIAEVLKTMFASPEFTASLGTAFKDPMHYVVSAVRLTYGEQTIVNALPMMKWVTRMSEMPYNHQTPDGYGMTSAAWSAPGQMALRFDIARQIGSGARALFAPPRTPQDLMDAPPAPPDAALYQASLVRPMGASTRQALAQAASPAEWAALYLSSPEFMRR